MLRKSFLFRPRLETLEERLPPGNMLGTWDALALGILGTDFSSPVRESIGSVDGTPIANRLGAEGSSSAHTFAPTSATVTGHSGSDQEDSSSAVRATAQLLTSSAIVSWGSAGDSILGGAIADPLGGDLFGATPAAQMKVLSHGTDLGFTPGTTSNGLSEQSGQASLAGTEHPGGGVLPAVAPRFVTQTPTDASLSIFNLPGATAAGADGSLSLGQAPDATGNGPLETTSSEYRLPATVDPDILSDRFTEIWARLYRPVDMSGGPHPLVIFLHGNHGTCGRGSNPRIDDNSQYTSTGTCPPGYVVTPNHLGYAYLAENLASYGYLVVSINANRGITAGSGVTGDAGLNLARGRLTLKHLQLLSEWNQGINPTPSSLGVDLTGQIDFSSVGLMGHSRGGEGVRAAYNLYRDPGSIWPGRIPDPVTFQAIFEIGAVDGQTSRILNADGTVWNQLLPMCDGDVSNLQGVKPFDRMMRIDEANPTQKSTFTVWGAIHNYYNTEWQTPDSSSCTGHPLLPRQATGSVAQQTTALASLPAFFRANVGPGADHTYNQNFNPQYDEPDVLTSVTRVDRGFTDSTGTTGYITPFEDFSRATGTSLHNQPIEQSGLTAYSHGSVPNHDASQRAGLLSWNGPGAFFQTDWDPLGASEDFSADQTLDMRLSRQSSALNPSGPTDFTVSLVDSDGNINGNGVLLSQVSDLRGPVGGPGGIHPILQTARFPLYAFNADLTNVRGVRIDFDQTGSGAIYLANINLSGLFGSAPHAPGSPGASAALAPIPVTTNPGVVMAQNSHVVTTGNQLVSVQTVSASDALGHRPGVEITVSSGTEFTARDELPLLRIGSQEINLSRYQTGDFHTLVFTATPSQFARMASGDPVTLQYGHDGLSDVWDFGRFVPNNLSV